MRSLASPHKEPLSSPREVEGVNVSVSVFASMWSHVRSSAGSSRVCLNMSLSSVYLSKGRYVPW